MQGFTRKPATPWFDDDGELAGIVHQERNWTYVLVAGAGHRVPQQQPRELARVRLQDPGRRARDADRRDRAPRLVEHRRRDAADAELFHAAHVGVDVASHAASAFDGAVEAHWSVSAWRIAQSNVAYPSCLDTTTKISFR